MLKGFMIMDIFLSENFIQTTYTNDKIISILNMS